MSKETNRRSALWLRLGRGLAAVALGAILLTALLYGGLSIWGEWEWKNAQRELRDKGERLTLAELPTPSIPDTDNFFATPIWREVLEMKPSVARDGSAIQVPKNQIADTRIGKFRQALLLTPNQSILSTLKGGYETGQRRNLELAAALLLENGRVPKGLSAPQTVLAALDLAQPELSELESAASRPGANPNVPVDENIFRQSRPHLTPPLSIAQYLLARITAEAADGRSDAALTHAMLLFRLADAMKSDPTLISLLVRISILSIATQGIWEGLAAECWTDAQLASLQRQLEQVDLSRDFVTSLRAERAGANQTIEFYLRKGGMEQMVKDTQSALELAGRKKEGTDWFASLFLRLYPRGLLLRSLVIYNEFTQQMIQAAEANPFAPGVSPAIQQRIAELQQSPNPILYPLVALSAASLAGPQSRIAFIETRLRQTQIALALEQYRLAKGEYPASLSDLVPTYLESVPLDVSTGNSFQYERRAPDQFTLWSVGANLTDEHGQPPLRAATLAEGDWVWQTAPALPRAK